MQEKFFIKTYGCQLNEADGEKMCSLLSNIGYEKTENIFDANLILLNTCCIRNTAEQKVYGKIGDLKRLKEKNKNILLGITGCVASKEKDNLKTRFPWIDFVIDTDSISKLPEVVKELRVKDREVEPFYTSCAPSTFSNLQIKANVIAVNGCNYSCSFCIVPKVRGKEVSRPIEEIVEEIKNLVKVGVVEVTLVGQNVVAYGRSDHIGKLKEDRKNKFVDLLEEVHKIDEIKRIRFVTSHPKDFTDEIIEGISKLPKVCEYFHLPIQSGDNDILKRMNRGYTVEYFKNRIEKIRSVFPHCAISTDIIVGFPGETDKQFENTLNVVKELEFDNAYTFIYSVRSGTRAEKFQEQIPYEVKKERLSILNTLQNEISLKKNKLLEGKEIEVLVESQDKKRKGKLLGRTRTNKVVLFEGDISLIGKIISVKVEKARTHTLEASYENKK